MMKWDVYQMKENLPLSSVVSAPRFAQCQSVFLAYGKYDSLDFNTKKLSENKTGNWSIKKGRVQPGDLILLLLSIAKGPKAQYELYAGIATQQVEVSETRSEIHVDKFIGYSRITAPVLQLMGIKSLPMGNRINELLLVRASNENEGGELGQWEQDYQDEVEKALADGAKARRARIASASTKPKVIVLKTTRYRYNPDITAEQLFRANGQCQHCGNKAPFNRKKDGTPYLEVHHIKPLSENGEDSLENTLALCPNCHRQKHHG